MIIFLCLSGNLIPSSFDHWTFMRMIGIQTPLVRNHMFSSVRLTHVIISDKRDARYVKHLDLYVHGCGLEIAFAFLTQRTWVRSPVGTGFLSEVFSGFSSRVRQLSANLKSKTVPEHHLELIIAFHFRHI